jgi:hypothetical protein
MRREVRRVRKRKFPVMWAIVLIFALLWFGKELNIIPVNFDFPWIPAIVIIIALGSIINNYT